MPREIDGGEQQIADLAGELLVRARRDSASTSAISSRSLASTPRDVVPVEADLGRLLLKLQRPRQRRQGRGTPASAPSAARHRARRRRASARSRFSSALIRPHSALTASGVEVAGVAEHMRMAADQLGGDRLDDAAEVEQAGLLGHAGMKDDLQQEVAELLAQILGVAALDGVGDLVGFFDRVGRDRGEGLLEVPGTAALAGRAARP